jgi:archaeal chaperonin
VAGGGAAELAVLRDVEECRREAGTLAAYGVDCVLAALKAPLAQIVSNAGFHPLEKLEAALAAPAGWGIDCDSGEPTDLLARGIVDPALVKVHALRAAGEVADAILRISTVIRKRDERGEGSAAGA